MESQLATQRRDTLFSFDWRPSPYLARMSFQALSVVSPSGSRIRKKRKTIEVRRWAPETLPIHDLVIVQNDTRLTDESPEDPAGRVVAIVDVLTVRDWTAEDLEASGATEFQEGFLAWELSNIRPLAYGQFVPAQLGIYELELEDRYIMYPESHVFPEVESENGDSPVVEEEE